jgi:O-antigen ligase
MIKIENYVSLLIFIIPLSFIIGIALTEILVLVSIIFFIINNKDISIYFDTKIIFLFLFSLYILLNSFFQITGYYSKNLAISSIFHFRFVLFSLSIFYFCKLCENKKKIFFFSIFIIVIILILIDTLIQFFYGSNLLGYNIINNRASSFFKDELILGSFLVRLFPIVIWSIFFLKINLKKNFVFYSTFFSIYFISIYIASERTSFFLMLVIMIFSYIVLNHFRKILTFSITTFIIFAISVSYFKFGSYDPANRIFLKTFNQITKINDGTNQNIENKKSNKNKFTIYSKDHEGHIQLAFKLFNENKIFGVGPKGFRYHCRQVDFNPETGICTTHPHNILIQIIAELGLVGLSFYIIAAMFVFYHFIKSLYQRKFDSDFLSFYSITLGLILNLFPLIPGGNFFNNWISIILFYNIGFYLYSFNKCIIKK